MKDHPLIVTLSGRLPADLANAVSDAIHEALTRGMKIDEACCVVVGIAADYARHEYGSTYLEPLAEVVRLRAGMPMPGSVPRG